MLFYYYVGSVLSQCKSRLRVLLYILYVNSIKVNPYCKAVLVFIYVGWYILPERLAGIQFCTLHGLVSPAWTWTLLSPPSVTGLSSFIPIPPPQPEQGRPPQPTISSSSLQQLSRASQSYTRAMNCQSLVKMIMSPVSSSPILFRSAMATSCP